MRNEKLRHKKIERNKKRRVFAKNRIETGEERSIRLKKYFIAGSRHGARKVKVQPKIIEQIIPTFSFWNFWEEIYNNIKGMFRKGYSKKRKDSKWKNQKKPKISMNYKQNFKNFQRRKVI